MTYAPIPFVNVQESGSDELGGALQLALNVVQDQKGTIRRRPGIQTSLLAPAAAIAGSAIVGLWVTTDGQLFAVDDAARRIWRVLSAGATAIPSTTGEPSVLGTQRPTFAETEAMLGIAGGGFPSKLVFADMHISLIGGSPPLASHVVANSARLLLNDLGDYTGLVHYSDLATGSSYAGHEVWTSGIGTAGYFLTESRPDPVVALLESSNEIIALGTTTMQAFAADAQTVYAPVTAREFGCGAPYSVIRDDNSIAWLDNARRFVISDTRDVQSIAAPIKGTLETVASPADCFGFRALLNSLDAYVWSFGVDGRTFVFQKAIGWAQWSCGTADVPLPFMATSHCLSPVDGRNLIGTNDGRIAELSMDAADDLGLPFTAVVRTGYINHDTDNRKWCKSVKFTLRRGEPGAGAATAMFGFRDRPGDWTRIAIDIGSAGDVDATVIFRSLGVYRQREWMFEFTGTRQLILAGATEEYEVLEA